MGLFSVILVVSTAGFIGINRTYTRGAIRKQLSESVQRLSSDLSQELARPQTLGVGGAACGVDGVDCPENGFKAICLSGVRYTWYNTTDDNGGLYKDTKECGARVETSDSTTAEVVDGRYVVEALDFLPVGSSSSGLYQLKGIIRTRTSAALTTTDNSGNLADERDLPTWDPYKIKCKGSSAGNIVQTCAVESFDIVINSRSNTL